MKNKSHIFDYIDTIDDTIYNTIRYKHKHIFDLHLLSEYHPMNHFEYMFRIELLLSRTFILFNEGFHDI